MKYMKCVFSCVPFCLRSDVSFERCIMIFTCMGSWPNDTAMVEGRVACNDELLFHSPTDVARYYYTSAVVESMVVAKGGVLFVSGRRSGIIMFIIKLF